VPQILDNIQRHVAARLLKRLLGRNRPRQIDNPIFAAVDQMDGVAVVADCGSVA
jgi:hypothetical protein